MLKELESCHQSTSNLSQSLVPFCNSTRVLLHDILGCGGIGLCRLKKVLQWASTKQVLILHCSKKWLALDLCKEHDIEITCQIHINPCYVKPFHQFWTLDLGMWNAPNFVYSVPYCSLPSCLLNLYTLHLVTQEEKLHVGGIALGWT